jgi:hypothetical protein
LQVRMDAFEKPNITNVSAKQRKNGRDMQTSYRFSNAVSLVYA